MTGSGGAYPRSEARAAGAAASPNPASAASFIVRVYGIIPQYQKMPNENWYLDDRVTKMAELSENPRRKEQVKSDL
jgi:hypothetical protein